ncbi:MAG: DUF1232 domain-containing protein [Polyangiaceae bacterium]|nr:DUF1232 domain-containing protein [Polyangiaceae bacterium]
MSSPPFPAAVESAVRAVGGERAVLGRVQATLARVRRAALEGSAPRALAEQVQTLGALLRDPEFVVPWPAKRAVIAALAYFVVPTDVLPDVLVGVGWTDDALVVAWALHQVSATIAAYREHRRLRGG